jgi:hypothetical protein
MGVVDCPLAVKLKETTKLAMIIDLRMNIRRPRFEWDSPSDQLQNYGAENFPSLAAGENAAPLVVKVNTVFPFSNRAMVPGTNLPPTVIQLEYVICTGVVDPPDRFNR